MSGRSLEQSVVQACVERIDPGWEVLETRMPSEGFLPVEHVTVETDEGSRQLVLKATPPDGAGSVGLEARILAMVDARTDVPVPAVVGAVDADPELPAPFFLMTRAPGETVPRVDLSTLESAEMERIARETGRHLAAVHRLDVVDAFGFLEPAGPDPGGEVPSLGAGSIAVVDATTDWFERLDGWIEGALEAHAESRFGDLTGELRVALERQRESLEGPFEPGLAHVDGSIENLRLDPRTREVVAMLDWAFTLAATPAYDLVAIEESLAGGHWGYLPEVPDFRRTVHESLAAGYASAGPERVVRQYHEHHDCYALLALVRSMTLLEGWWEQRDMPPDSLEDVARGHRESAQDYL